MNKEHRPIGGMTVDEYIIYNKGYTVGLEIGEAIGEEKTEERIIKLLETLSHDWNVPARDNSGDMLHIAEFCTACTALALVKGESK